MVMKLLSAVQEARVLYFPRPGALAGGWQVTQVLPTYSSVDPSALVRETGFGGFVPRYPWVPLVMLATSQIAFAVGASAVAVGPAGLVAAVNGADVATTD